MKKVFTFILLILTSSNVFADCSSRGIYTYPKSGTMTQGSLILIEGYAMSQEVIYGLGNKYYAYLQASSHKVELEIQTINAGQFELTQALLKPKKKLNIGQTYILKIDNLNPNLESHLEQWNSETFQYESISWKIESKKEDVPHPIFQNEPKLIDREIYWFGCGPAVYANFNIKTNTYTWIQTELKEVNSDKSAIYYLTLGTTNTLKVGHGMCSGAFTFKEDTKYKARFSLLDAFGNVSESWTEWIEFDSPYTKDSF